MSKYEHSKVINIISNLFTNGEITQEEKNQLIKANNRSCEKFELHMNTENIVMDRSQREKELTCKSFGTRK